MNFSKSNTYQSVLAIVLSLLFFYWLYQFKILLIIAIVIILLSLLHSKIAELVSKIWYVLANVLGLIMPKILLAIVYFLILTPMAFFRKIFKSKKSKNSIYSNFIERNKTFVPQDFEQTW